MRNGRLSVPAELINLSDIPDMMYRPCDLIECVWVETTAPPVSSKKNIAKEPTHMQASIHMLTVSTKVISNVTGKHRARTFEASPHGIVSTVLLVGYSITIGVLSTEHNIMGFCTLGVTQTRTEQHLSYTALSGLDTYNVHVSILVTFSGMNKFCSSLIGPYFCKCFTPRSSHTCRLAECTYYYIV